MLLISFNRSAPSSPTHHSSMGSHDYSLGRDSPQPHPSRSMVMLPSTYSLPSSPSRNHRPLKFTHLTLGSSTGSLQRFDDDPPPSKKLCLEPTSDDASTPAHCRPAKLFGTSSTALLTAMHRSMATRETPTMPNVNLGSKLKDMPQQPVGIGNNGSYKPAVQMVPISIINSNQGPVFLNIPFSQSQQAQTFIPMTTIDDGSHDPTSDTINGSHDPAKDSGDDEHDAITSPAGSPDPPGRSPDASVGSPDTAESSHKSHDEGDRSPDVAS